MLKNTNEYFGKMKEIVKGNFELHVTEVTEYCKILNSNS